MIGKKGDALRERKKILFNINKIKKNNVNQYVDNQKV